MLPKRNVYNKNKPCYITVGVAETDNNDVELFIIGNYPDYSLTPFGYELDMMGVKEIISIPIKSNIPDINSYTISLKDALEHIGITIGDAFRIRWSVVYESSYSYEYGVTEYDIFYVVDIIKIYKNASLAFPEQW